MKKTETMEECKCPKILVVDDSVHIREHLLLSIDLYSSSIGDEAMDGPEAIQMCQESLKRKCCGPY